MRLIKASFILFLISSLLAAVATIGGYLYLNPKLPSIKGLSNVQLQVPLRIYSSEGELMGEFGEKRRTPKRLDEIPLLMQDAFISAEDSRFYEHPGVDYQGILRAAINLIRTGKRGQGGSTITMQLARNFYLSSEKTYLRKLNEILLALKIEGELGKKKILELYLNKIYLGTRAYGVAAAGQVYYGAKLEDLTLAQIAMIAGLPKAPSSYNPIVNPERAVIRRNYVLSRMHQLGYINTKDFETAKNAPVTAARHRSRIEVQAPYVDEMVRAEIVRQFGAGAYSKGLRVYTTLKHRLQTAANNSLWNGLVDYDHRHGYRGVVRHVDITNLDKNALIGVLKEDEDYGRFKPALVLKIDDTAVTHASSDKKTAKTEGENKPAAIVMLKDGEKIPILWQGIRWARRYISVNREGKALTSVSAVIRPGDVIWVEPNIMTGWHLAQIPGVQGALVSIDPNSGAIQALTGGLDFKFSKFNRVTQARRQAGSGFKPVIYSAALAKSFTPATLINDAPVVFKDAALEGDWRPENYSGKFFGPTRLRKALYTSRNLVSIRILRSIGIGYAIKFAKNFGFKSSKLPHDLSLALGSCEVSPLQMVRAFSVFANGGYLIKPYVIQRIEDSNGTVLFNADPAVACTACVLSKNIQSSAELDDGNALVRLPKQAARTLGPRIAFQMNSILQDVIFRGTGRRALVLGRKDLAGKTGTTNEQRDAWFNGYNPDLVTTVWLGFDQLKPLGNHETAARAALPVWINFMRAALKDVPEKQLPRPAGLVTVKIDAATGEAATDDDTNTIFEIFRKENVPVIKSGDTAGTGSRHGQAPIPEQLF